MPSRMLVLGGTEDCVYVVDNVRTLLPSTMQAVSVFRRVTLLSLMFVLVVYELRYVLLEGSTQGTFASRAVLGQHLPSL